LKAEGPNLTIATGCPAAIHAIEIAAQDISRGDIDVAIVGGTETPITPFSFAGFCASRGLANHNHYPERASRPFDMKRSGYVLSEGAGIVVMEDLKHASSRSTYLYGEVLGCSSTNDGYGLYEIEPSGRGLYRSMRNALQNARTGPREIDYISAHAPSTVMADKAETAAIKRVFGEYAHKIPVSSIKSIVGQPLAASGMLQLLSCLLGIRDHVLPPTMNYEHPDPECDLDYVPNVARRKSIETALINAHGFGGVNASLIVRKVC
jgi:3-oxoacyl-[acyl-carrier-protein] synthase II